MPETPLHLGLPAELPFGADLLRDARDLCGERVELVDHLVDDVFDLENLPLHVDRDLLGEVSVGDRGRDLGHVTELHRQVGAHRVDVVGEVLPRPIDAFHVGLPAELPFGADLLGDARDLGGERVERVDHRVDGALQLEDLPLGVDRDLLGEVALRHGRRDLGDVPHLGREVRGQHVDVVSEVFPRSGDPLSRRPARRAFLRCRPPWRRA